ncbi:MAG: hypothetical protein HYZ53_07910 [Planctomycetes bacterium]|nr:hypothetical protein [Planctomycetota bacterium]
MKSTVAVGAGGVHGEAVLSALSTVVAAGPPPPPDSRHDATSISMPN